MPQAPLRSGDGVHFSERLSGSLHSATGAVLLLTLDLDVKLPGWRRFLTDPSHAMQVRGTAVLGDGIDSSAVSGQLHLFPEVGGVAMRYLLSLDGVDGGVGDLVGTKTQRPGRPLAVWADLTELSVELTTGSPASPWTGRVTITTPDVLRLATSIRGDAFTAWRRWTSMLRFYRFFTVGAYAGITATRGAKD